MVWKLELKNGILWRRLCPEISIGLPTKLVKLLLFLAFKALSNLAAFHLSNIYPHTLPTRNLHFLKHTFHLHALIPCLCLEYLLWNSYQMPLSPILPAHLQQNVSLSFQCSNLYKALGSLSTCFKSSALAVKLLEDWSDHASLAWLFLFDNADYSLLVFYWADFELTVWPRY